MIFGIWARNLVGKWVIKIPKDKYWGNHTPLYGDEVTVISKDGNAKTKYLGDDCVETGYYWVFEEMDSWTEIGEHPMHDQDFYDMDLGFEF